MFFLLKNTMFCYKINTNDLRKLGHVNYYFQFMNKKRKRNKNGLLTSCPIRSFLYDYFCKIVSKVISYNANLFHYYVVFYNPDCNYNSLCLRLVILLFNNRFALKWPKKYFYKNGFSRCKKNFVTDYNLLSV
jgi:hypothetical protein